MSFEKDRFIEDLDELNEKFDFYKVWIEWKIKRGFIRDKDIDELKRIIEELIALKLKAIREHTGPWIGDHGERTEPIDWYLLLYKIDKVIEDAEARPNLLNICQDGLTSAEKSKLKLLGLLPGVNMRSFAWWFIWLEKIDKELDFLRMTDWMSGDIEHMDEVKKLVKEWLERIKEIKDEFRNEVRILDGTYPGFDLGPIVKILDIINDEIDALKDWVEDELNNQNIDKLRERLDRITKFKKSIMDSFPDLFGIPFKDWYEHLYRIDMAIWMAIKYLYGGWGKMDPGRRLELYLYWVGQIRKEKYRLINELPPIGDLPFSEWYQHLSNIDKALDSALEAADEGHMDESLSDLRRAQEMKHMLEKALGSSGGDKVPDLGIKDDGTEDDG